MITLIAMERGERKDLPFITPCHRVGSCSFILWTIFEILLLRCHEF